MLKILLLVLVMNCVECLAQETENFRYEWLKIIEDTTSDLQINDAFFQLKTEDKKARTKRKIIEICKEIDAPIPVVMAIASIESNFNTTSKDRGGACVGIFQLKNGYGGCIGDDRYDLEKSIKALHLNHQKLKARWVKNVGSWDDFYYYGIHQKGFAGFLEIYKNRHKKLSEITPIRCKHILASKPRKADWQCVNDWWEYYENRFYKVYNLYK